MEFSVNFFYYDFSLSKLRIPGLNYDFMSETLNERKLHMDDNAIKDIKYISSNILKIKGTRIEKDSLVRLSALHFNSICCYKIIKSGATDSNPLFDFFISKDKTFSLSLKNNFE